jgi:hypothetical protein
VLVLVLENLLTRLVPLITAPAPARLEPDATHKSHRSHKSHPWYRPYAFEHEDEHEHEDDFTRPHPSTFSRRNTRFIAV